MDIKSFKSSYKPDFFVTYSTDYNHRVKDGFSTTKVWNFWRETEMM